MAAGICDTRRVNLLVLGDSNTHDLPNGAVPWPELVRQGLEAKLAEAVELRSSRLWVVGPEAADIAERRVAASRPDVAIVTIGTYAFTAKLVHLRVRNLFGERMAERYRKAEQRFERSTGGNGASRPRRKLNTMVRTVAHRVIGTASYASREDVAAGYAAVFAALARHEDLHVIALTYPGASIYTQSKEARRERAKFLPAVRAVAEKHHFGWVEGADVFAAGSRPGDLHTDGLHYGAEGQRIFASAIESRISERLTGTRR